MKIINHKGFTMVELLIVLAIIAILAAVAIPVYSSQLENARKEVDNSNLRAATGLAAQDYILRYAGNIGSLNKKYIVFTYKNDSVGAVNSSNMLVYPENGLVDETNGNCLEAGSAPPGVYFSLPTAGTGTLKTDLKAGSFKINNREVILMPLQQNSGKARFDITIGKGGTVVVSTITHTTN